MLKSNYLHSDLQTRHYQLYELKYDVQDNMPDI